MLTTTKLINEYQIEEYLNQIVQSAYENIKGMSMLLNVSSHDIDLHVAVTDHDEFEEAILKNFEQDEDGEIVDEIAYQLLMDELNAYFIDLHKKSIYFEYFPVGTYEVNEEKRQTKSEYIAVKGEYYAPFEDARIISTI